MISRDVVHYVSTSLHSIFCLIMIANAGRFESCPYDNGIPVVIK